MLPALSQASLPGGSLVSMNPYLLPSVEFGPAVLKSLIDRIPASRFDERLSEDRFTLREVVAHLVDFEPIFRGRMESAYKTPGITVEPKDEGQMAIDHDYASQDVHENLKKLIEERAKSAAFLKSIPVEAFRTPLVHPHMGQMYLEDYANMLLGHDMYHLEQITQYLP
jgi:uncharacterized damage-inducible protein DinB